MADVQLLLQPTRALKVQFRDAAHRLMRTVVCDMTRLVDPLRLYQRTEPIAIEGAAVLWSKDDAGKTVVMIRFPTGASVELAREP